MLPDIGFIEMALIAIIALLIIGPKDLPKAIRTVTSLVGRVRGLAREFRESLDEIVEEGQLRELRDEIVEETKLDELRDEIEGSVKNEFDFTDDINNSILQTDTLADEPNIPASSNPDTAKLADSDLKPAKAKPSPTKTPNANRPAAKKTAAKAKSAKRAMPAAKAKG